jgi:hypothetical protein
MATARDVISRSLRMLTAIQAGESASAEDMDIGVKALNDILFRYPGVAHAAYTASSTVTFADTHLGNVAYMLAYELASEFGRPIPQVVAKEYPGAQSRFAAQYQHVDDDTTLKMAVDGGLLNMPSQFNQSNYRSFVN